MKNLIFIFISSCLLGSSDVLSQTLLDSSIQVSKESIRLLMEEENIIGLSVTVSLQDSIIWSEGFGYSDLGKKKAIEPNTLFRIASISKPITATILARLNEESILNYEESIYSYVPTFPQKKYDFNLLQLATHRAGIRHYKSFEKDNRKVLSLEEGLKRFQRSKLKFKPGTDYSYSSYGYNLLGVAMEKASNSTFDDLLKTYITKPLGMSNTIPDYGSYHTIKASGFFISNGKGKVKEAKPVYMATLVPSGGMLSTSEDLVVFGNSYIYNRLLKEETQIKMLLSEPLPNGKKTRYGIGWELKTDKKGREIISHTGGNTGSVCRLIVYPESKLTVAVVSNTFGIDWLKFIKVVNHIPISILEEIDK